MFSWITSILKGTAALLGWGQQRSADNNTPEMKANAEAAERERISEQATKDVASGDLAQIRKDASEN